MDKIGILVIIFALYFSAQTSDFNKSPSCLKISTEKIYEGILTVYEDKARKIVIEIHRKTDDKILNFITVKRGGKLILHGSFIGREEWLSFYNVNGAVNHYSGKIVLYAVKDGVQEHEVKPEKVLFALEADSNLEFKPMKKQDFISRFTPTYINMD